MATRFGSAIGGSGAGVIRIGRVRSGFGALLVIGGFLWSCAQAPEREAPHEPVGEPPSASSERPAWAEGPVDRRAGSERSSGSERAEEPRQGAEGPVRGSDNLQGFFPDERVTLDYHRTDIRRVMRLFQVKSAGDIVLGEGVEGRITVRTDEVPIASAFRAVLRAGGWEFRVRGGTIVIETDG